MNATLQGFILSVCAMQIANQPLLMHHPLIVDQTVTSDIENITDKTITAYAIGYTILYRSGRSLPVSRTTDYAIGIAFVKGISGLGNVPQPGGFAPHSTVSFQQVAPVEPMDTPVEVREVRVRAVTFEDGTVLGDEALIASIFLARHNDAEILRAWLPEVESIVMASDRPAALLGL